MEKEKIEFSEFLEIEKKLEIKVGRVVGVEEIPKSKLLKLTVHFGEYKNSEVFNIEPIIIDGVSINGNCILKTVVTNIKSKFEHFEAAKNMMMFQDFLFITNLKPAKMMGVESEAMILPGELENGKMLVAKTKLLNDDGNIQKLPHQIL
jgi:tRNA-binding EMAP/Myf-like protein